MNNCFFFQNSSYLGWYCFPVKSEYIGKVLGNRLAHWQLCIEIENMYYNIILTYVTFQGKTTLKKVHQKNPYKSP